MKELTKKEKAKLTVGQDAWTTYSAAEKGVRSIRLSDGPGGLRIEAKTGLGFNTSHPAVCYPTASLTACSFDRQLLEKQGEMLAEECRAQGVSVLLGPGVNHKRSPLCGRNFEYFSEDPVLSGELAASYVNGLQKNGIGASLKHFAGNSRERGRQISDSIIDEKALHEIYLKQFEITVKKAQPYTVMTAYNRLNGTYCSENRELMEDIARKQWGYEGIFVSDWGAVSDPVRSVKNGLDLQMPGGDHGTSGLLLNALESGELAEADLERASGNIVSLSRKSSLKNRKQFDLNSHLDFAREAAERSAVLLKNEGVLPLEKAAKAALIGAFAKKPRYQGAGSSQVNAVYADSIFAAMTEKDLPFEYAQGYEEEHSRIDHELLKEAVAAAERNDYAVIVAGLPEAHEAEGYDRTTLQLPENQNALIEAVAAVQKNVIVVMQCGAPVIMPWRDDVRAVLLMYLAGSRGGHAAVRLLYGEAVPCGKLAETWPLRLEDTPCFSYFDEDILQVQYRESIFTGYRYYLDRDIPVQYPFGYGLSYTSFRYDDISLKEEGDEIAVTCTVTNTGGIAGRESVQVYTSVEDSRIRRPLRELKDFASVLLEPGEKKTVCFRIAKEDLRVYDSADHAWKLEDGTYRFEICASSADVRLTESIRIASEDTVHEIYPENYLGITGGILTVSDGDFEKVLGRPLPQPASILPITRNSSIADLQETRLGRHLHRMVKRAMRKYTLRGVRDSMVFESPLRMMLMASSKVTWDTVDGVAQVLNGEVRAGVKKIRESLSGENKRPVRRKTGR